RWFSDATKANKSEKIKSCGNARTGRRCSGAWPSFSGVRPSSGAETADLPAARRISQALDHAELAAPEDGRTPLKQRRLERPCISSAGKLKRAEARAPSFISETKCIFVFIN